MPNGSTQEQDTSKEFLTLPEVQTAYVEGLAQGQLTLPYCPDCQRFLTSWFNRCADHWHTRLELREAPHIASVWSWVVFHKQYKLPNKQTVPYVVAAMQIETGPRVFANLTGEADVELTRGEVLQFDAAATAARGCPVYRKSEPGSRTEPAPSTAAEN